MKATAFTGERLAPMDPPAGQFYPALGPLTDGGAQDALKLSGDQKQRFADARNAYLRTMEPLLQKQQQLLTSLQVPPPPPSAVANHETHHETPCGQPECWQPEEVVCVNTVAAGHRYQPMLLSRPAGTLSWALNASIGRPRVRSQP